MKFELAVPMLHIILSNQESRILKLCDFWFENGNVSNFIQLSNEKPAPLQQKKRFNPYDLKKYSTPIATCMLFKYYMI